MIPLAVCAAAEPDPASVDFRSYLDQAKFFVRKTWYADARQQLELAVATEDGQLDPEAWMLLAKVSYELFDLGRARFAADRALVQSRTEAQTAEARDLLAFFDAQFGVVTVSAGQAGATGRLHLELTSVQIDPDLKRWINGVADRISEPVVLPYVLGLPAGSYTVNGEPFTVEAGRSSAVSTRLSSLTLRTLGLEVGAGGTVAVGRRARDLYPAPTLELSATLPVGAFELAAGGTFGVQPFRTPTSPVTLSPTAASGHLRFGWIAPGLGGLLWRASVTGRIASTPGYGVPCAGDAEQGFACALDAPVRQLFVFLPGRSVGPGAELAAFYEDRRRSRSVGFGAKLGLEAWSVRLPASGTARVAGSSAPWTLTSADDRGFLVGIGRATLVARIGF